MPSGAFLVIYHFVPLDNRNFNYFLASISFLSWLITCLSKLAFSYLLLERSYLIFVNLTCVGVGALVAMDGEALVGRL